MKIFVDTSAWYAYFNENDEFHEEADSFLRTKPELMTSDLIVSETLGLIQKRINKEKTVDAGEIILEESLVEIVTFNEEMLRQTWDDYRGLKNGNISFVDCSCKIVMKRLGLREIFTFDEDFRKLGLKVVP